MVLKRKPACAKNFEKELLHLKWKEHVESFRSYLTARQILPSGRQEDHSRHSITFEHLKLLCRHWRIPMQEKHFWAKHTTMEQLVDVLQTYLDTCQARGKDPNTDLSAKQRHRTAMGNNKNGNQERVQLKRNKPPGSEPPVRTVQPQQVSIFNQPHAVPTQPRGGRRDNSSDQFAAKLIAQSRMPPDYAKNLGNMVLKPQTGGPRDIQRLR
jgi:hypothetical protein